MNEPDKITPENRYTGPAIDKAIRIGVIALLIALCFTILRPFISPVMWGIILAITLYPACRRLSTLLGGRIRLASAIITSVMLLCIILPSIQMVNSLVSGTKYINERIQRGEIKVPPPPDNIDEWPLIGKSLKDEWLEASANLRATLTRFQPQLKAMGLWLLKSAMGTAIGLLQFALSIIIAGIFMVNAGGSGKMARDLFVRLAGERGANFADIHGTRCSGALTRHFSCCDRRIYYNGIHRSFCWCRHLIHRIQVRLEDISQSNRSGDSDNYSGKKPKVVD